MQRFVIIACLAAIETLLIAPQLKHSDFDQYWCGAKIFLQHGNPYSPGALFALEKAAGSPAPRVVMLMTPPWTMPLLAPLGLLSYPVAHVLWFALGLVLLIASVEILWKCYRAQGELPVQDAPSWLPLVLAMTFVPNLSALIDGQILPLILFSLAAFLALCQTRHQALVGITLLGLGIKPHLTYLVTLAAVIWLFQQRRWTTLISCGAGLFFLCAVAWTVAPTAFIGYRAAGMETMRVVSGFGGLLRGMFGMKHYWLQFTPLIPGFLWFAWYSRRLTGGGDWDWNRHLPVLLLASIAMCAYGWWYDQALLTVALIPGVLAWREAARRTKLLLLSGFLAVALMQAATPILSLHARFYLWTGPALAYLYYFAMRQRKGRV